ncbi:MAG: Sec-independent protein translocase subunit TatA [Actinomycetes bacterium]
MLGQLRGWEWLIIVALILLLFGAKRLPDAARGLGRSMRIFKAETKGLMEDGTTAPAETPDAAAPAAPAVQAAPAAPAVQAAPAAPAELPPAAQAPAAPPAAQPAPVEQPERTEG